MKLLLAFMALAPAAAERPSPVNPVAGLPPDSVASVLISRIVAPWVPRYRSTDVDAKVSVGADRCTLDRADAGAFAAAVARARPLARQGQPVEAALSIGIRFDGGQTIGVILGGRAIRGGGRRSPIMIDGWLYAVDRRDSRAMRALIARCSVE